MGDPCSNPVFSLMRSQFRKLEGSRQTAASRLSS
jgi:hypothetical protein